jgi:nicotinamidase-related amidase
MPVDFAKLVDPAHTAVVTCEMQRGIIGDLAKLDDLAREVAARGVIENAQRLVIAARAHGVRVLHALIEFRADRAGTSINNPMLGRMTKDPDMIRQGSPQADLVPELGPEPVDLISRRVHGLSPVTGTDLDIRLRNLGVRTIVVVGVSINEAVFGLCIEAANLGYSIALPTDAVAGYPRDVVRYSISMMSNLTTVDNVIEAWTHSPDGGSVIMAPRL